MASLSEVPSEVAKRSIKMELERNRIRAVAFVGGALDGVMKALKDIAVEFQQANPGVAVAYFSYAQGKGLQHWVEAQDKATDHHVAVIGHSWGADTAASRVAKGMPVKLLVTFDPVSTHRPNFKDVRKSSGTWININGTGIKGRGRPFSVFRIRPAIAGILVHIAGAWNDAPALVASLHYRVGVNHAECSRVIPADRFHI